MVWWLFKKETEEEKANKLRIAEDIKALEAGDLPLAARQRLVELSEREDGFFTSDLSVNEFLLAKEAGYESLGMVMGTAFYKISFRALYNQGNWNLQNGELKDLSRVETLVRYQAIDRMRQEAALLDAHGVIGVRIKASHYDWAAGLIEVTVVGTAIRVPNRPVPESPFTSDLTGQEFWKLHQAGYWPVGYCFGVCSYYMIGNFWAQGGANLFDPSTWGNMFKNIELELPTGAMDHSRHAAMRRLSEEARKRGAEGVVDMSLEVRTDKHSVGSGSSERTDLILTFMATGTAIVREETPPDPAATKTLTMLDLRSGRSAPLVYVPPAADH
jgi:uncharacterized protein YbjQ (UPF0145 family)